ncbi:excalibur calcium-binding domain-containing protein [Pseudonocardia sediminis]|uniref:Excalibur calcium-binding domain-containing protein n=1 Tax=Pseudonocardia sediminis TaxID=1397368 RepID=A0A4Q7UYC5_PSEST|nr:excalibur calcium-binding domain-containing protein [Pseudonocardia sediminis]RZT85981.1 excalibur calcium-binding domain-containing protein [Pseudonocardia sediminis]
MRIRTLAASAVLAAGLGLPLAGVAFAQSADRDCPDFSSQAEAQAALQPGDPERLDRDKDGQACEDYDGYAAASSSSDDDSTEQVAAKPVGGVEAGDGPLSDTGTDPLPIIAGAVVAGGVGAVALRRVARRTS